MRELGVGARDAAGPSIIDTPVREPRSAPPEARQ